MWQTVLGDGQPLQHELGRADDHRITYGSAGFHISADATSILCAVDDPADPSWQRQLLDTLLFAASFIRGFELLHASAVVFDQRVVAFVAPSGGGKSTLAAELLRRGYQLFCDDVLAIGGGTSGPRCFPAPAVMNLPHSIQPAAVRSAVIASFPEESERWVEVSGAAISPSPLAAVYVLDRSAAAPTATETVASTALDFLRHAISLPHDVERARSRFALFSTLAERTVVRTLTAAPSVGPRELADVVEDSLYGSTYPALAVAG